ncbi:hypothetical protein LNP74_05100 [Klebsiella pneumoniae subsp. pneumoniae]|nr:hypothetical protein [Klebsiella pneumoniae subsp. pneumoniae]
MPGYKEGKPVALPHLDAARWVSDVLKPGKGRRPAAGAVLTPFRGERKKKHI